MSQAKILIVNDEEDIRLTLDQALIDEGYEVSKAINGQEALQKLMEQPFDLILLDLKMPGLDSLAVLQRMTELHPEIKIIIISARATVESAVEAMKLGATDFIQKPFTPVEIRDMVSKVLDQTDNQAVQSAGYQMHLQLARQSIQDHQLEAAREHVRQAIAVDASRPEAFNLLGVLEDIAGDHSEALKHYRVALDLAPTYKPARQNLTQPSHLRGLKENLSLG